jgi:oligopeptide transport system substrate-binding protein
VSRDARADRSPIWRLRRLLPALVVGLSLVGLPGGAATAAARDSATIVGSAPASVDPAQAGDIDSAAVVAQLYESLTAFDPARQIRPALAASWEILDGGRRLVFHLRSGLAFSDGSPLGPADVVRSWLRVIAPAHPSPLVSLFADVSGAVAYLQGTSKDPGSVGVTAGDGTVEVRFERPAASAFLAIAAGPTFAVVPPTIDTLAATAPGTFIGSGAYVLSAVTTSELILTANARYWAGRPPLRTIHLRTSFGAGGPVDAFAAGEVDYTPISSIDAAWIRYDPTLGPALRDVPALDITYYGFDTSRAPFNDARVRRAFAEAVDWGRIVRLATPDTATPATSMVPPGIPLRSERDFGPRHDPAAAQADMAAAGFPGGTGFPTVTLATTGSRYDEAVVADLQRTLGITVRYEILASDYLARLSTDPPAFWSLGWIADYPGPNDFLGLLLGTGSTNDYGRWSDASFDAAIARAGAASTDAEARAAYDEAETIVQREAPVIPVAYSAGSALARAGLLGATDNGLGILRFAGLAWAP